MSKKLLLVILSIAAFSLPPLRQEFGPAMSSSALAEVPQKGSETLRGHLQNAGTNYFTDQRLELLTENQDKIIVQSWLPSEIYVRPKGSKSRPNTMSDFIGKDVILKGHYELKQVKGIGLAKVFVVEEVQQKSEP